MLYLLDEAFRGAGIEESNESQALLPNLRSVPDDAWHLLPEGAARSIESIAIHVGACKMMYDDYAFAAGDAPVRDAGGRAVARRRGRDGRRLALARRGPWAFVDHVAGSRRRRRARRDRRANWGELRPTRWLIAAMITHDAYHAGEINHLRSMMGPDDRWRFQQLGFG